MSKVRALSSPKERTTDLSDRGRTYIFMFSLFHASMVFPCTAQTLLPPLLSINTVQFRSLVQSSACVHIQDASNSTLICEGAYTMQSTRSIVEIVISRSTRQITTKADSSTQHTDNKCYNNADVSINSTHTQRSGRPSYHNRPPLGVENAWAASSYCCPQNP